MKFRPSQMFCDLIFGIVAFAIIGSVIILAFINRPLYCFTGFIVGILYAIYSVFSINESVMSSVLLTEEEALNNTRKRYIYRVVVIIILIALFWFVDFGSPVAFIIGALGLKFSTYIQPLSDKVVGVFFERR